MTLFWSARNPGTSAYAASTAAEAQSDAREAKDSVHDVNERVDQLLLVSAAMWELVREKTGLTEEDLIQRVAILDARDGTADGKLTATVVKCPKCQRPVAARHQRCLYCGYVLPVESVFKTI